MTSDAAGRGAVVMVSASFHPYVGGSEKQALELSAALRGMGWKVAVLTRSLPGLPSRETIRGVEVIRLWAPGTGALNSLAFMASLFLYLLRNSRGYAAIHVHLAGSPALPAAVMGRMIGKPVIVKLGGGRGIGELAASGGTLLGRFKIEFLRVLGPKVAVVTGDLAREVASFGLDGKGLVVCPNGVDTEAYRPAPEAEKESLRKGWGWPEGLGFVYVGRLSPEKRLDMFLEAFAVAIKASDRRCFAAFVGEGPEKQKLVKKAGELGVPAFFHSQIDDVWRAYQAGDVFVLPSVSEGLSNSLLEAMSCGLAVLASRVGGTVDAVTDGTNGLLFDERAGLDKALGRFLAEPGLASALGRESRKTALRYSIRDVAKRYEKLYRGEA